MQYSTDLTAHEQFVSPDEEKYLIIRCSKKYWENPAFLKDPASGLRQLSSAGIFKQSMGARNKVGIGLSYRPAWLHRLAEFIPWNRFLGSINV
jgi:hypothetical protein